MEFHVREMLSKGLTATFNEQMDVTGLLKGRRDVVSAGPLRVSLRATGEEGVVAVDGELSIDLVLACSRCLDDITEHLSIPFFESFRPAAEGVAAKTEEDEEEDDVIEVAEDKVDLKPYVEEALSLFLPFAPLCGDDCKGLCPTCGQNLNERECDCKEDNADPRFAALKDLFKE